MADGSEVWALAAFMEAAGSLLQPPRPSSPRLPTVRQSALKGTPQDKPGATEAWPSLGKAVVWAGVEWPRPRGSENGMGLCMGLKFCEMSSWMGRTLVPEAHLELTVQALWSGMIWGEDQRMIESSRL